MHGNCPVKYAPWQTRDSSSLTSDIKSKWQSLYSLDRRHRLRAVMASNLGVPIVPALEAVVVVHQPESGQPRFGKDATNKITVKNKIKFQLFRPFSLTFTTK